jgi:predicted dehydrogenase
VSGLNVLVVGAGLYVCGRGSENLGTILPALYQAKKEGLVKDVKVAATDPASVKELKKKIRKLDLLFGVKYDIKCFPQGSQRDRRAYQKAVREGNRPDCAIISVPDQLHFEIAAYLINAGIHCLVVKPLAPTVAEVKKLIKMQKAKGIYGAVEFHKRYDRSNLKLRDVIKQGQIGDPLYFIVEYSQRKSIPSRKFRKWVKYTNIFQYLGIHYVDIIYFATGAKPIRVMAIGQKNYLASRGVDTFDSIQCLTEWQMPNGKKFTSSILTNWIDPECTSAMSDQKIKVIGTKGRYEADQKERGITIVTDEGGIETPNPDFSSFYGGKGNAVFEGYGPDNIRQYLRDVSSILAEELTVPELEKLRPTFSESLLPTMVMEAANRSMSQNGKWVEI